MKQITVLYYENGTRTVMQFDREPIEVLEAVERLFILQPVEPERGQVELAR